MAEDTPESGTENPQGDEQYSPEELAAILAAGLLASAAPAAELPAILLALDAPEVEVGSGEFLQLIAQDPSLADAAALGERVVTEGPEGWITIVWPDVVD